MGDELLELRERLTGVERELRATRRLAHAVYLFFLGGLVGAFTLVAIGRPPRALELLTPGHTARAPFTVVDTHGRPVFTVGADDKNAWLQLLAAGKIYPAVSLHYSQRSGGGLAIFDRDGGTLAAIDNLANRGRLIICEPGGSTSTGEAGTARVVTLGNTGRGGQLEIFDKAGKCVFKAP